MNPCTIRITGTKAIIEEIIKGLSSIYTIADISDFKKNSKSSEYRVYCTLDVQLLYNTKQKDFN